MADSWSNWAGNETSEPQALHVVRTIEDAQACVREAASRGLSVRTAGTGHSHYRLIPNDQGIIIDLSALSGVINVEQVDGEHIATIFAGSKIASVGPQLLAAGVGLANQGDIDRQSIAGAVATGTHGTGPTLGNFAAAVRGLEVINPAGEILELSKDKNREIFNAARLNLGAFGLVTTVKLAVLPAYRLKDNIATEDYPALRPKIETATGQHRHFEFFWYPRRDRAMVKRIDLTEEAPVYPIGEEGNRQGWSFEVLPSHRPDLHTEMEYSVPLEESLNCFEEIRSLMMEHFPEVRWPVEYRTLAADDVWLSTAYERPTATISLHQAIDLPAEPLFSAAEKIFIKYGGRPHWGKIHYLSGEQLAAAHPRWDDWWQVRDQFDPNRVFLNERLASWR